MSQAGTSINKELNALQQFFAKRDDDPVQRAKAKVLAERQAERERAKLKRKRSSSRHALISEALKDDNSSSGTVVQVPSQEKEAETPEDEIYAGSTFGGFGDYMRRKRVKLQLQNAQLVQDAVQKPAVFAKVAIYVNGITQPSGYALRELILEYGGTYHDHMDRKSMITHIIASNLTPAKWKDWQYMKVVKPAWLVDSAKAGKLLSWQEYRLEPNEGLDAAQGVSGPARNAVSRAFNPFASPAATRTGSSSSSSMTKRASSSSSVTKANPPPEVIDLMDVDSDPEPLPLAPAQPPPIIPIDPVTVAQANRVPGYASSKSNEKAASLITNDAWRKSNTAAGEGYVESYYKNSRLHHLATWKTELRDIVAKAQADAEIGAFETSTARGSGKYSMRGAKIGTLSPSKTGHGTHADRATATPRVIMHCDFDCFFVAAGLVSRPELRGKPVVVCHSLGSKENIDKSTSEIASASYEARAFGIRNGMSLGQAYKLCKDVKPIPYEFDSYKTFALQFYTILMRNADDLEAVSVDEALLDVSSRVATLAEGADMEQDTAREFALGIQEEVKAATGCTISIGISSNILLARLATRKAKPGGVYHLFARSAPEFMKDLTVSDLRGFGWSAKDKLVKKFGESGITVGELRKHTEGQLSAVLGPKTGVKLYKAVRGIDETELQSDKPRKSVSAEVNYGIRFQNLEQYQKFVEELSEEIARRLKEIGKKGRQLTLKLMTRHPDAPVEAAKFLGHGICDTHNKSTQLDRATDGPATIFTATWRLAEAFGFDPKELRGIGIQMQKLDGDTDMKRKDTTEQASIKSAFARKPDAFAIPAPPPLPPPPPPPPRPATFDAELPSFSQVDKSVLDELPEDIQRELRGEWDRKKSEKDKARARPVQVEETPGAGPSNSRRTPMPAPRSRSHTPAIPNKNTSPVRKPGVPDVRHITKQLAPTRSGGGGSGSPTKLASIFSKVQRQAEVPVVVSIDKLRHLGVDPQVFFALPPSDQREQLRMVEQQYEQKRALKLKSPAKKRVANSHKYARSPRRYIFVRRKLRGKKWKWGRRRIAPFVAVKLKPPSIHQRLSKNREKVHISDVDQLQDLMRTWVDSHRKSGKPPDFKTDVPVFSKYILECARQDRTMDRCVSVMRWWQLLIERLEDVESFKEKPENLKTWWDAFGGVKKKVDEEIVKRHIEVSPSVTRDETFIILPDTGRFDLRMISMEVLQATRTWTDASEKTMRDIKVTIPSVWRLLKVPSSADFEASVVAVDVCSSRDAPDSQPMVCRYAGRLDHPYGWCLTIDGANEPLSLRMHVEDSQDNPVPGILAHLLQTMERLDKAAMTVKFARYLDGCRRDLQAIHRSISYLPPGFEEDAVHRYAARFVAIPEKPPQTLRSSTNGDDVPDPCKPETWDVPGVIAHLAGMTDDERVEFNMKALFGPLGRPSFENPPTLEPFQPANSGVVADPTS